MSGKFREILGNSEFSSAAGSKKRFPGFSSEKKKKKGREKGRKKKQWGWGVEKRGKDEEKKEVKAGKEEIRGEEE